MKNLSLYENIPAIENNFSVKFRVYNNDKSLPPHWHEHIEMLYFTGGSCDFICNGKSFEVGRGDFVVVNSTEIHSFVAKRATEFFSILIYPAFFSDIKRIDTPIKNLIRADGHIAELMERMHREYSCGETGADMMLKGLLYETVAYLCRKHPYEEAHPIDKRQRASMLERLDRVIGYVTENYAERITTSALADMCYLSEAHFCRFFKSAVGKTVTQYVNGYRIEKASVLLRNTDGSVGEIAEAVGFEDLNYFSRVFRRLMGMTPGEYRASAKQ